MIINMNELQVDLNRWHFNKKHVNFENRNVECQYKDKFYVNTVDEFYLTCDILAVFDVFKIRPYFLHVNIVTCRSLVNM